MRNLVLFLISVCILLLWACPAPARTITVDDDAPADFNTIQAAIDDANDGDTVEIRPGTYAAEGNRDLDFLGKAITVRSMDPNDSAVVAATVIDCGGSSDDLHRGFIFQNGEDGNSVVSGLTIKGGYGDYGGAVYCSGTAGPVIRNCIIAGNTACSGGGICISGEKVSAVIENCTIVSNRAIANPNNTCYYEEGLGGGIYIVARGGDSDKSNTAVTYSLTQDEAEYRGGWYGEITTFCEVVNCTLSQNIADYRGGGICAMYHCEVIVTDSIVWGNTAPDDIDIGMPLIADAPDPRYIISYCNVKDGLDGIGRDYRVEWGDGNIDAYPCFVDPGYWDPNGTADDANDDFWVGGDYHLMSEAWRWDTIRRAWTWDAVTSRCIDAGNPASALGEELLSVPTDPGSDWGRNLRLNMGAYGGTSEASIGPYDWMLLADITNNGRVYLDDLASQVANWLVSEREISGDLNRNGLTALADFAILAGDWFKQTSWFGTSPEPPPHPQAWNPNPPDGADNIGSHPVLSWKSGYGAISHDVYFGDMYPPEFRGNQTAETFEPGPLSGMTTYYWRVDEVTPYKTTTGSVWRFTTYSIR